MPRCAPEATPACRLDAARQSLREANAIAVRPLRGEDLNLLVQNAERAYQDWLAALEAEYTALDPERESAEAIAGRAEVERDLAESRDRMGRQRLWRFRRVHRDRIIVLAPARTTTRARGAGRPSHRRTRRSTRAGPDSDSDGPGEARSREEQDGAGPGWSR